jgi:conjugative relaxase-like TrwC/TraI family protein
MLSLYTLKSAGDASKYYQQGDYYTADGAARYSQWEGKGALKLDLKGSVDCGVFKALLEGRLPNGEVMTRVKKGQYHRPGYDLTFSAPKSVSVLALVAGNKAVLQAHREAVQETLEHLEKRYAGTRLNQKGLISIERTQNLIAATFEHSDSRAGDPNLHTHSVILNMTTSDIWRALYADEFYQDKLFIGMLYRSALAQKLMRLGYELMLGAKGTFEIQGVPLNLIHFFSKRRAQIEAFLKEAGLEGGEAASRANFLTREPKKALDPNERQARWLEEVKGTGCSLEELKSLEKSAEIRGPIEPPHPLELARQAIEAARLHLSEKETTFTLEALIKSAKGLSLLPVNEGDLITALEEKIAAKKLLTLENKRFTTLEIKTLTREMTFLVWEGRGQVSPLMLGWTASVTTAFKVSHRSLRAGLISLLTSTDRMLLLKSTSLGLNRTLKQFIAITETQYCYPQVLTQSTQTAETLKSTLGTDRVGTLAGFLLACEERANKKAPTSLLAKWEERTKQRTAKNIWIVEGKASLQQIHDLQQWAKTFNARIILTETHPSNLSLEPLKQARIKTIDIVTTKKELQLLTLEQKLLRHLTQVSSHSIIDNEARLDKAVTLSLETSSLLVTMNQHERLKLNTQVRDSLKQSNTLGQGYPWHSLQPLGFTLEEKTKTHLYQPGYILRFNRDHLLKTLIQKGSYFEVAGVDLEKNLLILHQDQTEVFLNPTQEKAFLKHVEVFKKEPRELRVGDRLIWTRTIRGDANQKGQWFNVMAVNEHEARLSLSDGQSLNSIHREVALKSSQMKDLHWDYGYAVSLFEANIKDVQTIVLVLPSHLHPKTLPRLQDFLAASKNNETKIHLVCSDVERLKKGIEQSDGVEHQETLVKIPYKRKDVLSDYPILVTKPLFSGLQSAYLNIAAHSSNIAIPQSPEYPASLESPDLRIAADIVDKMALYQAERQAVFNLETVKKEAVQLKGIGSSIEAIEKAFDLAVEQGWLVVVAHNEQQEKLVTAKHTLFMEERCIALMKAGQNQVKPILPPDSPLIQSLNTNLKLTQGQKEAVHLILTTQDRMTAIQGIAGAGKTSALTEIQRLCQPQGFTVTVLANTGSAANQAKQKKTNATTTAHCLIQLEKVFQNTAPAKQDFQNYLFIVDESSLTSTQDFFRLQTLIQTFEARLVLIGDFKQQGSIGAGFSFHDFLAYGIQKAVMLKNVRLKDFIAFTAMKQAYQGDIKGTLQTLKNSIEEIPDKGEALNRIADVYCALRQNEPPLIITPRNEDRQMVNNAIRERLKSANVLTGETLKTSVFLSSDRREIDKTDVFSYEPGNIIRFNTRNARLNLSAGDYAEVLACDLKHQRLTLKTKTQTLYWSPQQLSKARDIEIYTQETRELLKNDIIVFKRNQKQLGVFNGDKGVITSISGTKADILLANKTIVTLDLSDPKNQHLDYGYALTVYLAQSKDVPFVIAYGECPKPYTKELSELRLNDVIVLPKTPRFDLEHSILTKIVHLNGLKLTLQDRKGKTYQLEAPLKSTWEYFPPFESRKLSELPLSTSLESLLITITRGDGLLLIVANRDDYQKTLEAHTQLIKKSALSHQDSEWQNLHQDVEGLVQNIRGLAEPKEKETPISSPGKSLQKPTKTEASSHPSLWPEKEKTPYIDQDVVNQRLNQDILGYATQWLGSPKKISGVEARWSGALTVNIRGPKAGMWKRWSTGEGGKDLISLYSVAYNLDWKKALQELGKSLNAQRDPKPLIKQNPAETPEILNLKAIQKAKKLYQQGIPISGTLAEKYLKTHRGIEGPFPSDFKFIASTWHFETKKYPPALLAPIRDKDYQQIGTLRIFLNKDGSKYAETYINEKGQTEKAIARANLGLKKDAAVIIQQGFSSTLFVAEGVETALSIAKAIPHQTVMASLSVNQFKSIPLNPEVQKIIICADKDESTSKTSKAVIGAVEHHLSQGKRVFIAIPLNTEDKKIDFNDLLQQEGITAVKKTLNQMVEIKNVQPLKESNTLELGLQKIRDEPHTNTSINNEKRMDIEKAIQTIPAQSKSTELQINR